MNILSLWTFKGIPLAGFLKLVREERLKLDLFRKCKLIEPIRIEM